MRANERERSWLLIEVETGVPWQLAQRQSEWTRVWATAGSESQTTLRVICTLVVGLGSHLRVLSRLQRRSKACWGHTNCHSWQITVVLNLGLQRHKACCPHIGFLAWFEKVWEGKLTVNNFHLGIFLCWNKIISLACVFFFFLQWEMLNYCIRKDFIRACLAHIFSLWEWSCLE